MVIRIFILLSFFLLSFFRAIFAQTSSTKTNSSTLTASGSNVAAKPAQPVFSPGDGFKLEVYPDTTAFPAGIYIIDENGYADFPILGRTKVTELAKNEIEQLLYQTYIEYLPRLTIKVRPLIRAALLGGFVNPGLYWVDPKSNLWELIRQGGGTLREDGIKKIKWERSRKIVSNDIVQLFQSGNSLEAIGFRSGDQLLVSGQPLTSFWGILRQDVLPILSVTLSAITTTITAYSTYRLLREARGQ